MMYFEYNNYFNGLFVEPLIVIAISLFVIILCFIMLLVRFKNEFKFNMKHIKYIFIIVMFSYVLFNVVDDIDLNIVKDSDVSTISIYGDIESINNISSPPRLYYQERQVLPSIILINNQEYYIMTIGDFEVGDTVAIEYLPNSYVVMSINYDWAKWGIM